MGRRERFTREQILDGALGAVVAHGRGVSVAQIGEAIGAPTGSIYHRFSSRDDLMAQLWLRSIGRFHERLVPGADPALTPDDALVAVARETVEYCRAHPDEALAMTLFSQERLLRVAPGHLRDEVVHVNDDVFALMARLGGSRFPGLAGDPQLVLFVYTAVIGIAYGLLRRSILALAPIPDWLDALVDRAVRAALTVADGWASLPSPEAVAPPPGLPPGQAA
ncbi:MAG: TetR/AcrR family transcriptional regulator [Propionibacteriaceae bacterium]|jgi:AcrR family transcriptional regulator|nr:TetR/AcrR family transcriptional regulator [Propionibacteriaceae bacterium]